MCRSLAEGGRRCPESHSGPSGRRLPKMSAELQRPTGETLTYRIRRTDPGTDQPYRIVEETRAADGTITTDDSDRCATRDEAETAVVRYVTVAQTELGYAGKRGPAVRQAAATAGAAASPDRPARPTATRSKPGVSDRRSRGSRRRTSTASSGAESWSGRPADVDAAITARYRELAAGNPGAWVKIRDVREGLPGIPRDQVDAALGRLYEGQAVNLTPKSYGRNRMTDDDRAAAFSIGGESKDLISIPLEGN